MYQMILKQFNFKFNLNDKSLDVIHFIDDISF